MSTLMVEAHTTTIALAFALAVPAHGPPCDAVACPADGRLRVDLLGEDFYFCLHHWREHCERLPMTPFKAVADLRDPVAVDVPNTFPIHSGAAQPMTERT